jgi:phosphate-selective porin OprO/OprP
MRRWLLAFSLSSFVSTALAQTNATPTRPGAAERPPAAPSGPLNPATESALTVAPPAAPQATTAALPPPPSPPPPPSIASFGPKGLNVATADGNFVFNLRFPFMFDYKASIGNNLPRAGDAFYPRFFGPIFTVNIYKAVTGKLIVGFQDRQVTVVNAWMDVAAHHWAHLKVGKVLYPISLERQTLPLRIVFLEHGFASQLLPISEFGVQIWGGTEDKLFEYQLTFGNGAPANQHYETDFDRGKDIVGRVYARPFLRTGIPALAGFGLGVGASWGQHDGTAATPLTGVARSAANRTFLSTRSASLPNGAADPAGTVIANGDVVRIVPQLNYTVGPVSLYAEYIRTRERLSLGSTARTITNQSAHAVLAVALTGEKETLLDIISPKRPLSFSQGGFGAFELVARFETIHFDKGLFPTFVNPAAPAVANNAAVAQSANAIGAGFNWIPVDIVRLMANYEVTLFNAPAGGVKHRNEHFLGARLQALF